MDPTAATPTAPTSFRLRLLGRFELSRALRVSPAGERLLAYLGIRMDPVSRSTVAAALWPDCTDSRAARNLRSARWRLYDQQLATPVSYHHGVVALARDVAVDLHDLSGRLPAAQERELDREERRSGGKRWRGTSRDREPGRWVST